MNCIDYDLFSFCCRILVINVILSPFAGLNRVDLLKL